MGCSFSGLNALYDAVNGGGDVWINHNRFRIVKQLGEGGFAFVYLVKEVVWDGASDGERLSGKKLKISTHVSDDGTYALKKVLVQSEEQLALVKEEIHVSSLFGHDNLLPLLIMLSLLSRVHKRGRGTMKLIYCSQFIWMGLYLILSKLCNQKRNSSQRSLFFKYSVR